MAIWETWTLGNLDFMQFGKLGLYAIWETWTLDNLGNLDFGQFANSKYWETYVLKNLTCALMAESISGLFILGRVLGHLCNVLLQKDGNLKQNIAEIS